MNKLSIQNNNNSAIDIQANSHSNAQLKQTREEFKTFSEGPSAIGARASIPIKSGLRKSRSRRHGRDSGNQATRSEIFSSNDTGREFAQLCGQSCKIMLN